MPKADTDNTSRRKWDKEEFEEKAKKRAAQEEKEDGQELTARQKKYRALDPLHQGKIKQRTALKVSPVQPPSHRRRSTRHHLPSQLLKPPLPAIPSDFAFDVRVYFMCVCAA